MEALNPQPEPQDRTKPSTRIRRGRFPGTLLPFRSASFWARLAQDVRFQLKQSFRVLKHPFEVFWEIRYSGDGSMVAAILLLAAAYVVLLLSKLATAYLFNPSGVENVSLLTLMLQYLLPWLTWVVANYMIGSIMKGQGKWTEVFVGSAYALMPFLVISLPLAVLSNVLTLNERVVYDFGNTVMIGWTLILFFIMAKEIHNYEIGETALNVVLSVLFIFAIWILLFILAGLTFQLYDFLVQVVREVSYRGG
ncbi:Yip1 family protein [Paenibacillus sp. MBLB4367]|uniref:Yip1 family protein n=1 Tax=Paenibacillus sp. MBLB4367 TaxID=3384767 RepID=UPI003907F180